MDKVEEILPRITAFLKDDLSKETLSSKAEKKRLYYVQRIEEALQEAAAQEIITKYEPLSGDTGSKDGGKDGGVGGGDTGGVGGGKDGGSGGSGGVERRSTVVRGNVLPTPFNRVSFPPAAAAVEKKTTTVETKQVMVAYEVLPCDQTYEEVRPRDVYEDATLHGTSESLPSFSSHSTNGTKSSIVHPPHPPPAPPSARPVSLPPLYDEAFQSNPEKIEEASDSDTDYEEYAETDEKEDDAKSKTSNTLQHDSPKLNNKNRQQSAAVVLAGKRHIGYLQQKGTFQFQRRFCALCGTRFLCCKSERSLKVVIEVDVKEYEVVQQERREGKTSAYPHELRFSCPGKETYLFYTESRQCAEDWVKEIRRASTMKQDSVEASATDSVDSASLNDETDRQSENSDTLSGGSFEKVKALIQNAPDDARKESKLAKILTFGKKLGNKTKNLFQSVDLGNTHTTGTEQHVGYLSIRSEEFTGDRWFRRFCRIEHGHLNCYTDQQSTDVRPEFSIDLRGAQLKPSDDETNELKIKLVKDGKEHCLKMSDTMQHGQWLVSLITVSGYGDLLGDKLRKPKVEIYEQPNLYEDPFLVLSGATVDDTNPDDEEPPPLPTDSPPASPMPEIHEKSSRGLQKNSDPEGIYLQPSQWLQDVEKLKRNKRRKPLNGAPVQVHEECAYINRDFVRQALNSRGNKDNQTERGSINSSSSYPNLSSIGMDDETKDGSNRLESNRGEAGSGAGNDSIGGRKSGKFRPSSALVESLENLTDDISERSGRKNCRGVGGVTKGSSLSFDRGATGLGLNQPRKKQDEQGWPRRTQSNTKIMWDELMRSSRSRTSGSESSDDLNNKKMVLNLVQMFEKKV